MILGMLDFDYHIVDETPWVKTLQELDIAIYNKGKLRLSLKFELEFISDGWFFGVA